MSSEKSVSDSAADSTKKQLAEAIKLVNDAIAKETKRLEDILNGDDEQSPIMVEGETFQDYYCQMMVNPKDVAKIMLDYSYPTWRILGEDAPVGMWEELGRKFGVKIVSSVDL